MLTMQPSVHVDADQPRLAARCPLTQWQCRRLTPGQQRTDGLCLSDLGHPLQRPACFDVATSHLGNVNSHRDSQEWS